MPKRFAKKDYTLTIRPNGNGLWQVFITIDDVDFNCRNPRFSRVERFVEISEDTPYKTNYFGQKAPLRMIFKLYTRVTKQLLRFTVAARANAPGSSRQQRLQVPTTD